ncbi:glutamine amidotransferase [Rosistilla oblonga]|uniref:glutamine amidotransferase n=1 Tax=Rosistilla oblonga TaxID=2527990 RepID=UPI003A983802
MFDSILIAAPQWTAAAVAICLLSLLVVAWAYWRRGGSSRRGPLIFAGLLKWIAIAALALCLLQPMLESQRPRPHANLIGVVVDNSRSMQIRSPGQSQPRSERLAAVLKQDADWQVRLSQDYDVRRYAFDRSLQNVDDLSTLEFDGASSSLTATLTTLAARFRDRPVAGLMLFTDGNATDLTDTEFDWSSLGFPLYLVTDSVDQAIADLKIDQVSTAQTNFEASPVTVTAKLSATGLKDSTAVVRLLDAEGVAVEEQEVELTQAKPTADVEFRFRPKKSGLQFYSIDTFPKSQRAAYLQGETKVEATLANNSRLLAIDRDQGPYRVLYVAGRPNWEFKFLRRALQEDDEIRLVGLLRIARKEPKFSFRDRGVNSSNPLFSGFDENEEESAEQYDEPVLLRLGVDEAEQLSKGFPRQAEELFGYHAIILDDVDADFFTQDQMLMLRQFVSTRGGGLLMLGGQESFAGGDYEHTPLADLMPVYLPRGNESSGGTVARIELSREGWLQPWLRLRETEVAEKKRLAEMPEFGTLNRVGDVKPGASMLASAQTGDRQQPALVVQRYGKGRSGALLIGDLWRWGMRRKPGENEDLQQVWRQTIRWMIADVPRAVEIDLEESKDSSKPIEIAVTVRNPEFLPLDNASVALTVVQPDGEEMQLPTQPSDQAAGVYTASYWPSKDGAYRVKVVATGPDGSDIGSQQAGWTTETATVEFQRLAVNKDLLQQIADQTGGEVVSQEDLDSFVANLHNKKIPLTQRHLAPLWHGPWVLIFALVCLCGEWGVRRFHGMP